MIRSINKPIDKEDIAKYLDHDFINIYRDINNKKRVSVDGYFYRSAGDNPDGKEYRLVTFQYIDIPMEAFSNHVHTIEKAMADDRPIIYSFTEEEVRSAIASCLGDMQGQIAYSDITPDTQCGTWLIKNPG